VTGLKFDRTLQDTPTSVKVFTSEEIDKQNLISVYDLIDRTANLSSTFARVRFQHSRHFSTPNVSGTGFGDLATVYLDRITAAPRSQRRRAARPVGPRTGRDRFAAHSRRCRAATPWRAQSSSRQPIQASTGRARRAR
jgi:hypothetical protein